MRTWPLLTFLVLSLLLGAQAQTPAGLSDYIRYHKTAPLRLETGVVEMKGPGGQTLDLIAAVHLADASYYQKLNERFRGYDAVLFELVLPEEMAGQQLPSKLGTGGSVSGLQSMMSRALGLTTQIESVDYSQPNFVHADLTQEALSKSMADRQESLLTYIGRIMSSSNAGGSADVGVTDAEMSQLNLIALMSGTSTSTDRRILKKIMATAMTGSDGMLTAMGDSAILTERNKAALKVLERETGKGRRRLAIFYGAAHLADMESRLTAKGWKRTSLEWLPAWSF